MNRADKMLSVLRDGRPHSRRDLFDRIGFFLTNNAASELRAQGHDVRQHRKNVDGVTIYSYQWFGSLNEGDAGEGHEALAPVALDGGATSPSLSEPRCRCGAAKDEPCNRPVGMACARDQAVSEPEQPVLFEESTRPAWA